jgi:hypothetical protein
MTSGSPVTFNESVAVDAAARCGGRASFSLIVRNGDDNGGKGVSSGTIAVNGQTIVAQSDLSVAVKQIERPVTLGDSNTLSVQLGGGARDSSVTVSIVRIIEEPAFGPLVVSGGDTGSATFAATPGGTYSLFLQDAGSKPVQNAIIAINGADVISGGDLAKGLPLRRRLTLQSSNTITARVTGNGVSSLRLEVRKELGESACAAGVAINILTPAADTILNDRQVLLSGTVSGGTDLGVTVNGVVAVVQFDAAGTQADPFHWTATIVPSEGNVTLSAVATNGGGATAEDHRNVAFAPDPHNFTVAAFPSSGPAPLTVTFTTSPLGGVSQAQIDYDGDGVFEFSGPLPNQAQHTYSSPGQRVVHWRITRADGTFGSGSAIVTVQSFAAIDAVLTKQWNGFADTLATGDIERALTFLAADDVRYRYRGPITLIRENLARYAAGIRDIHPVFINDRLANYLLIRNENGSRRAYHIYFVPDANGIWKIAQF